MNGLVVGVAAGAPAIDARASPHPGLDASGAEKQTVDAPASPESGADATTVAELARIRHRIERVDRAIVELIAERVALAREVGAVKRALDMPTLDPPREAAVVRRASALAREAGLAEEDVRYVFWHLVGLCRRVQLEEE